MNNIANKVVVITGASSGLGETTVRYLASQGAKVVLAARRADRLNQIVQEISQAGGQALAVITDVSKKVDVDALIETTIAQFGRVDVLVNNAGLMAQAPLAKCKVDEWDRMIDINIKGVLYGIAAVLPYMQQAKSGHIINLSSVAGLKVSVGGGVVYSATKFAVKAISEGLRAEMAPYNIRVTTLYPGAIESELKFGSSDQETGEIVQAFYRDFEISSDSVAHAIAYAISQPDDVGINDITIRPTRQEF